ncbi:SCO2583 family membrane protein [Streptomyces ziwulingensis]
MAGPGDPPGGTPEGFPGGGEDEYRSVVFDESFVRAARLQEFSAQERIADRAPAVRSRAPLRRTGLSRQLLVLAVLIAVAFGTTLYMGVRHPYQRPAQRFAEPARMTVVPLAPVNRVPGAEDAAHLYEHSPAAHFRPAAEGVPLPGARRTAHFSYDQVLRALTTARHYIVRSALDPDVLGGQGVHSVRVLLAPDQLEQFDESFERPAPDGRHAPTGWLVRFDPARAQLDDAGIRVNGSMRVAETEASTLEVTADHTMVYPLRPAGDDRAEASLFTVRRELRFRFGLEDLRLHQTQLVASHVQAGPLSCAEDSVSHLRPLLAGQTAGTGEPPGTDPYTADPPAALCGTLASGAQPRA